MKKMVVVAAGLLFLSGCAVPANRAERGSMIGAGSGAVFGALAGQLIGKDTKSTVIGAAIGTVAGAAMGNGVGTYMDKQEKEMRDALATSQAVSIQREQENLALSFKSDLLFNVDSADLSPSASGEIARVAEVLTRYPRTTVIVAGFTDSTGSAVYNQQLSELRAESVKRVLVKNGLYPLQIETHGYGEIDPVASNSTSDGRQLNRRVEITLVPPRGV